MDRSILIVIAILAVMSVSLFVAGCRAERKGDVVLLENITEASLRSYVERLHASGDWVRDIKWYVISPAAWPGHLDFNYKANMVALGEDTVVMYRVSVVPTYGKYPEDYYDIKIEQVEPQEGDY